MLEKASSPTGLALNRPHFQLASPPAPLQGERGVMCFVRPHPLTATGLTPNPSPRGEGSDVLCKTSPPNCYWPHPQPLSKRRGE